MPVHHFIVATAGHVDHGKSALVKALTGIDPDRLPEEKARGITIDLGFAHLDLASPTDPSTRFHLGLIDVPGHEDFVKNMVAGVGSIDLALLIVAADDGWMPQTEEHLQILTYLGVTRAVVALTKIDLVAGDETAVVNSVRDRLTGSPFAPAPVIPTSVITGRGLDLLQLALAGALGEAPPPADYGKPRLPVDRVFTLHGIGTVVTGTLTGGCLKRGQALSLQPAGRPSRVRSLQSHHLDVEQAHPGSRTAINLPDVSVADVSRGHVITLPQPGAASDTVDVLLERSARLQPGLSAASRPLKNGALVRVHHGSAHTAARLRFDGAALGAGERVLARLRFASPVFLFVGDRFIVRDWPEQNTLAGGRVLESDARPVDWTDPAHRALLAARAQSPEDLATLLTTQLVRDHIAAAASVLLSSRFSQDDIARSLAHLAASGQIIAADQLVADPSWWRELRQRAVDRITAEHQAQPQKPGLLLSDLKHELEPALVCPGAWEALLGDLCRREFVQAGVAIRLRSHRLALPTQLQAAGARLRASLGAKPFEPPPRSELLSAPGAAPALRFLLDTGEAIETRDGLVILAEALARATAVVREFLRAHGPATAGELRQALGTNRRVIIPLLERLDAEGVTVRQGDKRTLRPALVTPAPA